MQADLEALLRCRLRHEFRRALRNSGSMRRRLAFLTLACSYAVLPCWCWRLYCILIDSIGGTITAAGTTSTNIVLLSLLNGGLLFLVSASPEVLREVGFAPDQPVIQVSPVSAAVQVRYRLAAALVWSGPFLISWFLLPLAFIHRFIDSALQQLVWIALWLACCIWLPIFCLRFSVLLHVWADRRGISRHYGFIPFFAACVGAGLFAAHALFTPGLWMDAASGPAIPLGVAWGALLAILSSGPMMYRSVVACWPGIADPAACRRRGFHGRSGRVFSRKPARAVFQKDVKDLTRNPAYRIPLILSFLCIPAGLWAQWNSASTGSLPSGRRMLLAGSLLYLTPLFISARTVTLEFKMLDFYRLALPHAGTLLGIKWRFQAGLNVIIVTILALPLFAFLRGGNIPNEPLLFAMATVFGVPVLTMLALALGTFFPVAEARANPVGMGKWGVMVYFLLALVLLSLLVNGMKAAATVYLVFLTVVSGLFFHGARLKLK